MTLTIRRAQGRSERSGRVSEVLRQQNRVEGPGLRSRSLTVRPQAHGRGVVNHLDQTVPGC